MAHVEEDDFPWHEGENKIHSLLRVPHVENPTSGFLTPWAGQMLTQSPLLALGTLDEEGRPWTTVWGSEPGFSRPVGNSVIGVNTLIDNQYDPVVKILFNGKEKMVGGLAINLETRKRVKLYGRMVAGAISSSEKNSTIGEAQLTVKIEQSLDTLPLPQSALDLLAKSDLFFISSSNHQSDMDTNHRGGPPGFVRVISNDPTSTSIVYPEYSGNRLYQSLGNLMTTPRAGIVFPDFETGNVLFVTGTTEILIGADAEKTLPRSNLAVKITLTGARFVERGLGFRGIEGERSPYNPPVRYLTNERQQPAQLDRGVTATLIKKEDITPTISSYRFRLSDPVPGAKRLAGQYVALSFENKLSKGYSHMRDEDPESLNDDYLRTFTVSSPPSSITDPNIPPSEFEITVRKHGHVTNFLSDQQVTAGLQVPFYGFGGNFFIQQKDPNSPHETRTGFLAGGIGITPLMAQFPHLNLTPQNFRLLWSISTEDLPLVTHVLLKHQQHQSLGPMMTLFVTGRDFTSSSESLLKEIKNLGSEIHMRRIQKTDFDESIKRWYLCASPGLRGTVLGWLQGDEKDGFKREVVYEDFGY